MFLEMVVFCSMRRASIHAQVLPISRGETWAVSKTVEMIHCAFFVCSVCVWEGGCLIVSKHTKTKLNTCEKYGDEAAMFSVCRMEQRVRRGATRLSDS